MVYGQNIRTHIFTRRNYYRFDPFYYETGVQALSSTAGIGNSLTRSLERLATDEYRFKLILKKQIKESLCPLRLSGEYIFLAFLLS